MSKKQVLKICFFIFIFSLNLNVNAKCSTKELNTYKQEAYNLKFQYQYLEPEDIFYESSTMKREFLVTVSNLTKNIGVKDTFGYVTYNEKSVISDKGVLSGTYNSGVNYEFEVYTTSMTNCEGTKLLVKKIGLPNYNKYSEREECQGLSEYDYCQIWYEGTIDSEEDFQNKIKEYRNDIENKKEEKNMDTNWIDIVFEWVNDNLAIVIPTMVIVIGVSAYIIIDSIIHRKKKIRIKI